MTEDSGFAERERLARAAWEFFSDRDADDMSHQFRGGYHQGFIDGRSQFEAALSILTRLVEQANAQKFQGNTEVDEHGFIMAYRMPCGPVHAAIPFLARFGIVVDEYGVVHRAPETHASEGVDRD